MAVVAAQSRHVPTSAWFTGTGLSDMFRELGDLTLATIGYSILGMALGQLDPGRGGNRYRAAQRAAWSVLDMSMAIVIGPTRRARGFG